MSKLTIYLSALGVIFFFASFISTKRQNIPLTLHDEKFTFTPNKYYIVNIADGRIDRSTVALLIGKEKQSPVKVDLKDGAVYSIKNFLNHNLHRDTTLRPVLITIMEFKFVETALPNGMISGDLKVVFSFSDQLSYKNKHLVDFKRDIRYRRSFDEPVKVEPKLRRVIVEGLTYFDNWSNKQASK